MDFQQLLAKMVELDQPATEAMDTPVTECPPDMAAPMSSPMDHKPEVPEPSMSLNLNAQGMDNIESLMKLMTKVNPDMINQPNGAMPPMPTLTPPGPSISSISNLDAGPLKMLPDLDADNDNMPGGEKDIDGEEPEMKKDKEEAFANSELGDEGPETMDIDAAIPNGDDLHKKKSMHKAAAGGDNAMAAESTDLRSQIRAELLQRLAEAKGAK
jgi:hypothetical protein